MNKMSLIDVFFISVSFNVGGVNSKIALFQLNILEVDDEKPAYAGKPNRRNKLS